MTTLPPYLSTVDGAEPARDVPTPRDLLQGTAAERLEAGIKALGAVDVAAVPVVDLPQRPDVPSDHQTFIARVTTDTGTPGAAPCFDVVGVSSWREHEGRLDLYGPVAGGNVTRIASVAPFAWKTIERLDRAGRAR